MGKITVSCLLMVAAALLAQDTIKKPEIQNAVLPPVKIFKIVIDPGHGGRDGGAVGSQGTKEKDAVLEVANLLAKSLADETEERFKVILTRAEDRFIPLEDRISFANQAGGDVFISIHANSSESKKDYGFEIYYNSLATDDSSFGVVKRENAGFKEKKEAQNVDSMFVLWDLAQNEFQKESMDLADKVQAAVEEAVKKPRANGKMFYMRNRGVKQAAFAVLRGVRMPAVLIETSYLSNEEDENNLKKLEFKERLVEGILTAIKSYTKKNSNLQEVSK
ncbi:MAG: N-acetylmuramoyl-L-alanine amidase [Candidatus Firestonebacteria bacterium]|nr:N-acetylmuramoyl-L-alanine amidase [Candidatus Firestonebacteria bacterium]